MKFYIGHDYEAGTWLEKEPIFLGYNYYPVEISEELWNKEQRIKNEYEDMQHKLYIMWDKVRREAKLADTKDGVKPKGFD